MAYSTAIGDSQPVAYTVPACALAFPIVKEADLGEADHPINNTNLSGKREGACVIMKETADNDLVLVIAVGSNTTSAWTRQDTLVDIVPA